MREAAADVRWTRLVARTSPLQPGAPHLRLGGVVFGIRIDEGRIGARGIHPWPAPMLRLLAASARQRRSHLGDAEAFDRADRVRVEAGQRREGASALGIVAELVEAGRTG